MPHSPLVVRQQPFSEIEEELRPLVEAHYLELAHFQDIPLDPHWEFYRSSPILRTFSVTREDRLIGYAIYGVGHNKHYKGSLQAIQDILYVDLTERGGVGRALIREVDKQLKAEGVQAVYQHVKVEHPALGEVLRSEGYELVETVWVKRLDRE